jgi:hypothetical protein
MSTFKIDFYELSFLAEACIPPRPIARIHFWQQLTDRYWHEMDPDERVRLFEWIQRHGDYQSGLKAGNNYIRIFHARFDPNNQYEVTVIDNGEEIYYKAFKVGNQYWTGSRTSIAEDNIIKIEKIEYGKSE